MAWSGCDAFFPNSKVTSMLLNMLSNYMLLGSCCDASPLIIRSHWATNMTFVRDRLFLTDQSPTIGLTRLCIKFTWTVIKSQQMDDEVYYRSKCWWIMFICFSWHIYMTDHQWDDELSVGFKNLVGFSVFGISFISLDTDINQSKNNTEVVIHNCC